MEREYRRDGLLRQALETPVAVKRKSPRSRMTSYTDNSYRTELKNIIYVVSRK